jgi:hypothetical protein
MTEAGKLLMLLGGLVCLTGGIVWVLGRAGFRGMPGDIIYQSPNVQIYVPIVSCLLLSVLLSALLWLWQWLMRR